MVIEIPTKKKNFRYGIILVKRTAIAYRQNLALYLGYGRCGVGAPLKIARVDFALGGAGFLLTKAGQKKSIKMLTSKSEGVDADGKKATCLPPVLNKAFVSITPTAPIGAGGKKR